MSDRSRNCLDDSSVSKQINTDPCKGTNSSPQIKKNLSPENINGNITTQKGLQYLELLLEVSPHLNVFYVAFPVQPLLNLIKGSFKGETFLDDKTCVCETRTEYLM